MPTQAKSGIKFGEPPAKRERRYDWAAIAADLRKRPGEWAKIFDDDLTSLVTSFRLDGFKDLPTSEFEYRTENNKREYIDDNGVRQPRRCTMWLRYTGD